MSFSIAPTAAIVEHAAARPHRPAAARPRRDADRRARHGAAHPHRRRHRLRVARPAVADPDRHRLRARSSRRRSRPRPTASPARDSGVASAMVSTSQQIGGSIGTALLSTLAASAATALPRPTTGRRPPRCGRAAVEGYTTAFWWAAAIFAVGALVTGGPAALRRPPRGGPRRAGGDGGTGAGGVRRGQLRPAATSRSYFSVMCATAWFCCSA